MFLIPYVLGIIASMIIAVATVLLNHVTRWEIQSLNMYFVFPVGGFLLGAAGALAFFYGKKILNRKILKADYIFGIFCGLLVFFSVNYISYQTLYIQPSKNGEVNIINQFSKPKDGISIAEHVSFFEYMNIINSSSSYQTYINGLTMGDEFTLGKTTTTILFYLQIIAALVGSFLIWLIIIDDAKYCDVCKKYYKIKILKSFNIEYFNSKIIENIKNNLKNSDELKKIFSQLEKEEPESSQYGNIELSYCPKCHTGDLFIKFFEIYGKKTVGENTDMRIVFPLEQRIIMNFITKDPEKLKHQP